MKRIISIICVIALLCAMCVFLTACGDKDEQIGEPIWEINEPAAISFVLGPHSNFPGVESAARRIYSQLVPACLNYCDISYAVVEGQPKQTDTISIEKETAHLSSSKKKSIAKSNAKGITQKMVSLSAATPEVDTLQSVRYAAGMLGDSAYTGKYLLIYDSGLCTTGLLSQLTANVIATDPQIVADRLESLHALPNLTGVQVRWIGLGCVSGEQPRIPDSYAYSLQELWRTIIERAGGQVTFDKAAVIGEEADGLPPVSVVEFPPDSLDIQHIDFQKTSMYVLDTVKFIGDQTEYVDPAAVENALTPFAEYLAANPRQKVLIAGLTAKIGSGNGIELSRQRAERVKDALVEQGVPANQIECVGLGCSENCLRVEDHNADGSLNEAMAAKNRAIYMIRADSLTARSLKGEQI